MIGGNITASIQKKTVTKNAIGENTATWAAVQTLTGWLDYSGGDSKRMSYDAKLQESTHIFICDYVALATGVKASNSRMLINGKEYDILLFDNPMELNVQWEIFLKYVGD